MEWFSQNLGLASLSFSVRKDPCSQNPFAMDYSMGVVQAMPKFKITSVLPLVRVRVNQGLGRCTPCQSILLAERFAKSMFLRTETLVYAFQTGERCFIFSVASSYTSI